MDYLIRRLVQPIIKQQIKMIIDKHGGVDSW